MMDELDLKKLLSFDSLNFKLRYFKAIKGEGGPKPYYWTGSLHTMS